MQNRWRWVGAAAIALLLCCPRARCQSPATQPQLSAATTESTARLDMLAMGDWGEGKPAQQAVATALADYVIEQKVPFAAMLLAGDNFYVPLRGIDDPQWQTLFEKMYDPEHMPFPFYVTLGNHDYDAGKDLIELAYARVNPQSRWKFPARWYRVDLPAGDEPMVTLLMLDSNKEKLTPVQWRAQSRWLETELAKPRTAKWVICVAHHPLFSNGVGSIAALRDAWGGLFEKYHVDFYLCGHEHNLQHLEVPDVSTSFVMAGGGGAHAHPLLNDNLGPFSKSVYGFVHFELTPARAIISYIGTDDKIVHQFERSREGKVKTLVTTPSDEGVKKPLELIQGLYDKIHGPSTEPATRAARHSAIRSTTAPTTEPALSN